MSDASAWGVLGSARVSLTPDCQAQERVIRGELWILLQNPVSGRQVRITPDVWALIRSFDGRRSVIDCLDALPAAANDAEREVIGSALAMLLQTGFLHSDLPNGGEALWRAQTRQRSQRLRARWLNPLAVRVPMHDPDRWLGLAQSALAPLFRRATLVVAALLCLLALVGGWLHADEISLAWRRLLESPTGWWIFLPVYLSLKAIHEFAHAVTLRRFGGHVHEIGITLLVLMPVPYVEASDIWRLPGRRDRVLVASAGIIAELSVAAIAALMWIALEPGVARDVAFATALAGSVTTLLFNANPLLRFDGYHVLQEAIDVPNLGPRASGYWLWLGRRYLFGLVAEPPPSAPGELPWLLGYGALACVYRWFVTFAIALWLAGEVPFVGMALALFALWQLVLRPLALVVRWLGKAAELEGRRARTVRVATALAAALVAAVTLVPLPSSTRVEGVLSVPGDGRLVAPEAAEVSDVVARPGTQVAAGDTLVELVSVELDTEIAMLDAEIAGLAARRGVALVEDPTEARLLADEILRRGALVEELAARRSKLVLRAPADGLFMPPGGSSLIGRTIARGELVGYLIEPGGLRVRGALEERRLGRMRDEILATHVRLAERPGSVLAARLQLLTPAAGRHLPSAALATVGAGNGGGIRVAAGKDDVLETLSPVFRIEVELPADVRAVGVGGRAYMTFRHPSETLARRAWLGLRGLFLEQLAV